MLILRGNSGSGKTTTARALQQRRHHHLTLVSQDVVRRDILKIHDGDDNPAIDLIELIARFSLDGGRDVIVEGILNAGVYGAMLRRLVAEHRGLTRCFAYNLTFDETVERHGTKPNAHEFGPEMMRQWYRPLDLVDGLAEDVIPSDEAQADTIERVAAAMGWAPLETCTRSTCAFSPR